LEQNRGVSVGLKKQNKNWFEKGEAWGLGHAGANVMGENPCWEKGPRDVIKINSADRFKCCGIFKA